MANAPGEGRLGAWAMLVAGMMMIAFGAFFAYRSDWRSAVANLGLGPVVIGHSIHRLRHP